MDYAKSIALGGKNVYPSQCSPNSYASRGLVCPYCGEPVHLRPGTINKSHFAHFPDISTRKLEECRERQKNQGYQGLGGYGASCNNLGQRLKIFQQNFLQIILTDIEKSFNHNTNLKQLDYKIAHVKSTYYSQELELNKKFVINLLRYQTNSSLIFLSKLDYSAKFLDSNYRQYNYLISREAIEYLTRKSSLSLLNQLIDYSVYHLENNYNYNDNVSTLFKAMWSKNSPLPGFNDLVIKNIHEYFIYLIGWHWFSLIIGLKPL
jgi:hypothetical protein